MISCVQPALKWIRPGADDANIATDLGYREIDIMGLATAQLAHLSPAGEITM